MESLDVDCIILGGGPAGLAAAQRLREWNCRIVVLEKAPRVGGRSANFVCRDILVNEGASFLASFYTETRRLATRTGVRLVRPKIHPGRSKRNFLATADGWVPHSFGSLIGLFRFPKVSFASKLRTLANVAALLPTGLHVADTQSMAAFDSEDAESWGRRQFGKDAYEYLVRAALEPYYYFSASECSAGFCAALVRHSAHWHPLMPAGGMGKLCEGFSVGIPIETGAVARSVERNGAGFRVRYERGLIRARTVIVALPADRTLELDIELTPQDREMLSAVKYAPGVRLMLRYSARNAPRAPNLTPGGPGRHALMGVCLLNQWEEGRVPSEGEVLWISAAGWRGRELANQPSEEIITALTEDCRRLGVDVPKAEWAEVIINRQGMVVPGPGHYRRVVEFNSREREGVFFAGDWMTGSTVEGAVRSGLNAANAAARHIQSYAGG